VRIALLTDGDRQLLEVDVSDNGHALPDPPRPGIGLVSMRERAAEVGGTLSAGAGAGGGTRVLARLPLGPGVRQDPPDG
jgi:signal transduction histidine kinase